MKRIIYTLTALGLVVGITGCGSASNNLGGATDYSDNYYDRYNDYTNYDYEDYDDYTDDMYGMGIYGNSYGTNGYSYNRSMDYIEPDYSKGGSAYWDGYGINSGRPLTETTTDYNSNSQNLMKDLDDMGNNLYHSGQDVVDGTKDMFEGKNTNTLVN